jgi:hypothetical protein
MAGDFDMAEDHYAVLGVAANASKDEILHAYTELAKQFHPDYNPDDPHAGKRFIRIQHAFEMLHEPKRHPAIAVFHSPASAFLNVQCRRGAIRVPAYSSDFSLPLIASATAFCVLSIIALVLVAQSIPVPDATPAPDATGSQTAVAEGLGADALIYDGLVVIALIYAGVVVAARCVRPPR